MKEKTRTYHAVNNTFFGILAAAVTIILNMLVRVTIVEYLGDQINGLNSLFISTISILALVQMGFSTAMIINLYKPVQEQNQILIAQLLNYYKEIYLKVALLFLALGLVVCLFLIDKLVTTTINMTLVKIYFMLFVMSYFVNYCTYYKRSLLFAEQKNRISVMSTMISELVFRGLSIVLIMVFRQYAIFLVLLICDYAFSNWCCAKFVDKHHPYLKKYRKEVLPENDRKSILKTIKPLMVNQISDTVQKSSQSILISALLGNVAIVGYYGSYQLISSAIQVLMTQIGSAFTSGFGNLSTLNDERRLANVFLKFFFVVGFCSIILCTTTICCIQDLIQFLFGKEFILPSLIVILIFGGLFLSIIGIPIISVQNALGLHKLDSKWMVMQAILAVLLEFLGGKLFGMTGILIGFLIPTIIFTVIGKSYIITKYVFKIASVHYFRHLMILFFRLIVVVGLCMYFSHFITTDNLFLNIVLKGILGFILAILLLCLTYSFNPFFLYYFRLLKNKLVIHNV